ncbi:MAG: heparan-alpha-glucosaminide N-acetyltransferase domain-containing protein [Vicinamibacteria bacterium]|nr:heparan-alpha-glucosaminide N-acetyltransferase domain-containing protein [Vicinamibacteria bacterium]
MNRSRLPSIDALRGLIMAIMALDHVRDFFHVGAMTFQPDDLSKTNAALFFTRWVTHICAPVFMFTTGVGAFLWADKPGRTTGGLSRFLLTRGLWLIFLELTVLRFAYFFSLTSGPWLLTILWAIGGSMIALSVLARLPVRILAPLSLLMIGAHNALDGVRADAFGAFAPAWNVLHQPGVFRIHDIVFVVGYPLVPWIAVMAAGYCFGGVLRMEAAGRQRFMTRAGVGLTAGFLILRGLNVYGDPQAWSMDVPGAMLLSFLRTTKYPPSLLFLLMTLGPALLILAWFDRKPLRSDHPLVVLGRVPLFFFLLHFSLAHVLAFPLAFLRYGEAGFLIKPMPSMGGALDSYPAGFGYSLPEVYLIWLLVLALSYPLCRWFADIKARRSDWWLSYL